jgi:glycosyltransferase involved in cell wall biosynthesis
LKASILYLTYDGLNDPLGQSQILPYLEGLAEKGYGITVISFEKSASADSFVTLRSPMKAMEDKKPTANSQQLRAIQLNYHKSPPVLSTLYDIYLLKKAVKKAFKNQQIDIIHCRSYITSLVGLWAKRKYGVKFIFDMRGFWADERVEGGLWNLKNPVFKSIYQYFKRKEKEFLLESDVTVSLTENAKEEIEQSIIAKNLIQRSASTRANIEVIPTCADLCLFDPQKAPIGKSRELRKKLGIGQDDFVLLYLGSLGTWYMLKEMLDFFAKLKLEIGDRESEVQSQKSKVENENTENRNSSKLKFVFLTKEQNVIRHTIEGRGMDKGDFVVSSCPREQVPNYISVCDASIFFIIPTYSKKASSATKMGEIMAMGKPVITNTGWGDVEEIMTESAGVLVTELSDDGYQQAIRRMSNSKFDAQYIRKQAVALFSLQNGVEKYDAIYHQLMFDR